MKDKAPDHLPDHTSDEFFSEIEKAFLDASEAINTINSEDEINLEFEKLYRLIQSGLSLSENLNKKIKNLSKQDVEFEGLEDDYIRDQAYELIKKMSITHKTINQLVITVYKFCEKHNKFWHNCSLENYKNHFQILKENYIRKFPDSNEMDFLKNEYEFFYSKEATDFNLSHNTISDNDFLKMTDYLSRLDIDNREFFNIIKQRKLEFVKEEINKSGFVVDVLQKKKGIKIDLKPIGDINDLEDDKSLSISNLPGFNIEERYEILVKLEVDSIISTLNTSKKSKNMILALIMGISVDNAKKLLDGTYKLNSDKEKNKLRKAEIANEIEVFFERNKIEFKK